MTEPLIWMPINETLSPPIVTTNDLTTLCGIFPSQAKTAAIVGLLLALIALFWFSTKFNIREKLAQKGETVLVVIIDKLLIIGMAICYAVVIARVSYAG